MGVQKRLKARKAELMEKVGLSDVKLTILSLKALDISGVGTQQDFLQLDETTVLAMPNVGPTAWWYIAKAQAELREMAELS